MSLRAFDRSFCPMDEVVIFPPLLFEHPKTTKGSSSSSAAGGAKQNIDNHKEEFLGEGEWTAHRERRGGCAKAFLGGGDFRGLRRGPRIFGRVKGKAAFA
jgi:hypothetical protein